MSDSVNFTADNRSEYSIRIIDGSVKVECYLMGSITGGTGTECFHTVGLAKVPEFLEAMNSASLEELMTAIGKYKHGLFRSQFYSFSDYTNKFTDCQVVWY